LNNNNITDVSFSFNNNNITDVLFRYNNNNNITDVSFSYNNNNITDVSFSFNNNNITDVSFNALFNVVFRFERCMRTCSFHVQEFIASSFVYITTIPTIIHDICIFRCILTLS